ncbi:MAG TPA: di-heme oxidoredictase family protein, partial [Longimicrobiales bacterium]
MRTFDDVVPAVGLALALLAGACTREPPPAAEPGAPLPGLDAAEFARFRAGEALFNKVFTPEHGLGPFFNENQCSACHTAPASGGTGEQRVVRAAHLDASGACDPLTAAGGENVRQQATPLLRAHGITEQAVPANATTTGRFTVPFLFGLGLIEAIPDAAILAHADPDDADGDGISGRAARTAAGRLARFGRKAEHATILDFTEGAIRLEMGLTTPSHPDEMMAGGGAAMPPDADPAPDPEVDRATLERLSDYVRFLAPLPRRTPTNAAERTLAAQGERLFHAIGCASCHVPTMRTGRSDVEALDRRTVSLYSDLLLHDLGPELAGVCGRDAGPAEFRTGILMGLIYRDAYLHDGRTRNLTEAILLHGGEATAAREAFRA